MQQTFERLKLAIQFLPLHGERSIEQRNHGLGRGPGRPRQRIAGASSADAWKKPGCASCDAAGRSIDGWRQAARDYGSVITSSVLVRLLSRMLFDREVLVHFEIGWL